MTQFFKIITALCAPLLLSGCLLLPGKFNASLKLMQGDKYEFSYIGEMQIFAGDDKEMSPPKLKPFDPKKAQCSDWIEADGSKNPSTYYNSYAHDSEDTVETIEAAESVIRTVIDGSNETNSRRVKRNCTVKELASLKQQEEENYERRKRDYEQKSTAMASMFGGAIPGNDDSLKRFASQLLKYEGWEKVEYAGNNIFNVEFKTSGTFDHYFAFPVLNDAAMQYPFFQIVRRKSGEFEIMTPALGGGPGSYWSLAMLGGMPGGKNGTDPLSAIDGSFTLETDGEILANNSPDGYETSGQNKILNWQVKSLSESPRALIRFK